MLPLDQKHLLGLSDIPIQEIQSILDKVKFYKAFSESKKRLPQVLENNTVANLFFENSTRTRFSFEMAAKKLGALTLNFEAKSSSLTKGEDLYDTLKTFEAMGIDIAVIRHSDHEFVSSLNEEFSFSLINAGSGSTKHPSQALLDAFTILDEFASFEGLRVCFCGDVLNSRVAKSDIALFKRLGMQTFICGPDEFMPKDDQHATLDKSLIDSQRVDLDWALKSCDVIIFLRVQHERHKSPSTYNMSSNDYHRNYGLNKKRLKLMPKSTIFMHPGPVNKGVEIEAELIESGNSRILNQVRNGIYTRMAIFDWIRLKMNDI